MAASEFAAKAEALEVKSAPGRLEPSLQLVEDYEREFGLALPADYREFLASYGGVSLSGRYPFAEPTPFGQTGMIDHFFGFVPAENRAGQFRSVQWNTRLIDGAPDVVAIGDDLMGGMTWLKCTDDDAGSVYHHDGYQRWIWSDAEFYAHFPNLHPDIVRYLELRRDNRLPTKPRGYENVYLIARSFSEFIGLLRPASDRRKPLPDPAARAREETEISEAGTTELADDHGPRDTPILSDSAPPLLIRLRSIKSSSICGAIDLDGKWRITPVYKDVLIYQDFIVAQPFPFGHPKSSFVFFDAQGNQIGERTHRSIFPGAAAEGLLALDEDGKWGYIDRTGKFVIPPRFDMAYRFANGEAKVIDAGVLSYIDKGGKVIMRAPAGVDSMSPYNSDGIAVVIKDDKGGLIRRDGTFVVPPKFAHFGSRAEGVIAAGEDEDGPLGLLDYSGKWIKAPQFDWIDTYSGGLAEARKDGRSGYIDTCGNWRIQPQYSCDGPTWPFSKNGTIVHAMDGGKLLVGRDGNEKPLPEGWGIDFFRWEADLVVVVDRDAKRGLMDSSGKIVVAPKYAWLEPVGGGVYIAHRVGNIGDDNRLILDVRRGEIEIDPPPVPGWSD